ncbi:hypothetical protein HPB52_013596 [Rhipicephalus sanguineus]|uniref:CCHC-type domain-containing protein n=1 Tax=Rhipicephalus sanguineus TaxID=34632 RepID=A0A9D4PD35_RHISA|nr:hypothetical protein HPB52_013596 [Rhipicephalus sanguineus]
MFSNKRPLAGSVVVGLPRAPDSHFSHSCRGLCRRAARLVPVVGPSPSVTARRHNNMATRMFFVSVLTAAEENPFCLGLRPCSVLHLPEPLLSAWLSSSTSPSSSSCRGHPRFRGLTGRKCFSPTSRRPAAADWNDARRASALVSLLGREGQRKYFAATEQEEALTTPSNAASVPASDADSSAPAVSKFDRLVKQLDRLFAASTNPLVERHEFTSRRQLPGESFLDYVTVLKEKAVRCKFGLTYAERVRDQVIHGSSDARVREKLLAYGEELTLEKAEEIVRTLEALSLANHAFAPTHTEYVQAIGRGAQDGGARKKYGHGQSSRGGRDVTPTLPGGYNATEVPASQDGDFSPKPSTGLRAPVPNGKFQGDFQAQSCDRCGSRRHQSNFRNCPARSRRCNTCNAWGHFASMCRKTAPVQRVTSRGAVDVAPEQQASTQLNVASTSSVLSSDHPSSSVLTVSTLSRNDLVVHAVVDGVTLQLLVDARASVSLMTAEDFYRHFSKQHSLSKAVVDLRNFSKQGIGIIGSFQAPVEVLQRSCSVVFSCHMLCVVLVPLMGVRN